MGHGLSPEARSGAREDEREGALGARGEFQAGTFVAGREQRPADNNLGKDAGVDTDYCDALILK